MKVLAVFGTRPEAIKLAPVLKILDQEPAFTLKICVTAQHREMLDQVLSFYDLKPDFDLNIMSVNQHLTTVTQMIIHGLEKVFSQFKPDWILVQGDTNTTFAASLTAYYNKISVAHIEAGLRTHNIYSPFPEEINRQLTSRIANLHFAPTFDAQKNLLSEGIEPSKITVTGNTIVDAVDEAIHYLMSHPKVSASLAQQFSFLDWDKKLILVTSHRRENFGESLEQVCQALLTLSKREDVQIVYPVHLNPNIYGPVNVLLANNPRIFLLKPQDYLPFIYLMYRSYLILTDSGGIQEEAPSLKKPVLVLRNTTERPEGIAAGAAKLVGTQPSTILQHIEELCDQKESYEKMSTATNPYGDGKAAQRILDRLQHECHL